MEKSCSHWWHAPVYTTISVTLAFIAISTAFRSNPNSNDATISSTNPVTNQLSLNTSQALRKSGFNTIATLLQISPELFLSSPESTVFAFQDSAISNISLPSLLMKQLVQYHILPFKMSMNDLLKKQENSCLQTLFRNKNVSITRIDNERHEVEINHVLISHPDVFLGGPISVHGVLGPFSPLKFHRGLDFIQPPICGSSNSSLISADKSAKNRDEWIRIVRLLSSKGFVSFAIGLHSVLDSILQDYKNLSSVTLFVPPDVSFLTVSSPVLDKTVRLHLLPQRFAYEKLASMPEKSLLRTLVPGGDLEITRISNSTHRLVINGVEITSPEIFGSKNFVVHGVRRAFKIAELLPSTT